MEKTRIIYENLEENILNSKIPYYIHLMNDLFIYNKHGIAPSIIVRSLNFILC